MCFQVNINTNFLKIIERERKGLFKKQRILYLGICEFIFSNYKSNKICIFIF